MAEDMQTLLKLGEEAARTLQSPAYNHAYGLRRDAIFTEWLQTDPQESRKREALFWQMRGLIDTTQAMAGMVQRAQDEIAKQQQSPQQAEQNYLDNQGFGTANLN